MDNIIFAVVAGILITGGSDSPTSVELYLPDTGQSCLLPSISGQREVTLDTVFVDDPVLCWWMTLHCVGG